MVPVFFIYLKYERRSIIMPRKGKNIYQRKDGRWEGRYIKGRTETGKAVYGYVYALTYEEAKKKRDEAADGMDSEKLKKNVPKRDSAEAVAIVWIYSLKPQIKKSTFCKYHTLIYSYIMDFRFPLLPVWTCLLNKVSIHHSILFPSIFCNNTHSWSLLLYQSCSGTILFLNRERKA